MSRFQSDDGRILSSGADYRQSERVDEQSVSFDASSNPVDGFTENVRLVGRNVLGALKDDGNGLIQQLIVSHLPN
jgi:hypothetical protein